MPAAITKPATPPLGTYRDSIGTHYEFASRPPWGLGLYRADAPAGATPVQNSEVFAESIKRNIFTKQDGPERKS